jgi:acyl carrier protein
LSRAERFGVDELRAQLLAQCHALGLLTSGGEVDCDADLLECGLIDSMGLLTLQSIADETYGVFIPDTVFIAQLRTINKISTYIEREMTAEVRARLHGAARGGTEA